MRKSWLVGMSIVLIALLGTVGCAAPATGEASESRSFEKEPRKEKKANNEQAEGSPYLTYRDCLEMRKGGCKQVLFTLHIPKVELEDMDVTYHELVSKPTNVVYPP